jgi:hypothetical protein
MRLPGRIGFDALKAGLNHADAALRFCLPTRRWQSALPSFTVDLLNSETQNDSNLLK